MTTGQHRFAPRWQGTLSDYVTAIAWSPNGQTLAASSAAGEIALLDAETLHIQLLQDGDGQSVDSLAISHDGQFLATGGQNGQVQIWQLQLQTPKLITTLENPSVWVDQIAWNPVSNQLAFSLGRYVQIWDVDADNIISTFNFEASSVLDMDWHPNGQHLALCGYQGAKIWAVQAWDEEPEVLLIPSASVAIAWSADGKYLADGNLDNTLTVLEWKNPNPWVMRGFPGKVRHLTWSQVFTQTGAPLLGTCSSEAIVVWQRDADESVGWASQVLTAHEGIVRAIAFQPGTQLLASAAEDGWVCLWHNAQELMQVLDGVHNGFSCLSWHSQGNQLAAGGRNGELCIWSITNDE